MVLAASVVVGGLIVGTTWLFNPSDSPGPADSPPNGDVNIDGTWTVTSLTNANGISMVSGRNAPIIVTFHAPADPRYAFKAFYDKVRDKGFILYPGKLTQLETFRVGCIGAIGPDEMRHAVNAVRDALADLGVRQIAPAAVRAA